MRKAKPTTHPGCRSLLQKAVRRGEAAVADVTAQHLAKIGDGQWLKMRSAVIVVEECWPLAAALDHQMTPATLHQLLTRVAKSTKLKDAAGLGSLGYALSQGDTSVLEEASGTRDIKIVAAGIDRPYDFWRWIETECTNDEQRRVVHSTQRAFRRGGWPWDRAFMIAAAYLAASAGVPAVTPAPQSRNMPWWVALDKHTPEGKRAISDAAKAMRVPVRQATWLSFYFESALSNALDSSPWWNREINWRLKKIGLTYTQAEQVWSRIRPLVAERLCGEAGRLQAHVSATDASEQTSLV